MTLCHKTGATIRNDAKQVTRAHYENEIVKPIKKVNDKV